MLRAGALAYVIVVSLIISMVLTSLIALSYFHRKAFVDVQWQHRLLSNAHSGFELLLASPEITESTVDLFDTGDDSVLLAARPWGIFEVATCKAFHRSMQSSKTALIGYAETDGVQTALYLSDQNRPLSLAGKTRIYGDAFLPEAGVKRAYIERQNFVGDKLIHGKQLRSGRHLPTLNTALLQQIKAQFTFSDVDQVTDKDSLEQPFYLPTMHYYPQDDVLRGYYNGNVIIHSSRPLVITRDCILQDVQVYAPRITIQQGFKGCAQFFVTEYLELEKEVQLDYPSALMALIEPQAEQLDQGIVIGEQCRISGTVLMETHQVGRVLAKCILQKDALVQGEVYVNGLTELHGSVWGSVYTSRFYLKTPSSIYENHLLNAEIDVLKRHPAYVGSNLLEKSTHRKVLKWLH